MEEKKIKSALISVFSKDGIEPIVKELSKRDVKIYSTGGTYNFISKLGYKVIKVEDITNYPSILSGRVKTLHPKIFGGILSRRELAQDMQRENSEAIAKAKLDKTIILRGCNYLKHFLNYFFLLVQYY